VFVDNAQPLAAGAATSALQITGNTSLSSIDTKTPALVTGRVPVDGSGVTQPISAAALPLPTGAATAALQTTINTSIGTTNTNLGAQADASATTDTGTFSLIAFVKRGLTNWTTLLARIPALVGGRTPVDGSGVTQPISAAALPLPTGAATSALQTTGNNSTASIDGKLPAQIAGRVPVEAGVVPMGGVVTSNPVRIGARAVTANYTALATNVTADVIVTAVGAQITKPYSIPEHDWQYACPASGFTTGGTYTARAAGAAGIRNYVTAIQIASNNTTVDVEVVLSDGATPIWRIAFPYNATNPVQYGPISIVFPTPLRGTAATALNIVTNNGGAYVSVQGYQAP
jgi:hypothetical protein